MSLAAQRAKVVAYAALYDLELVAVIEDAGASAKTLNRPGLQRALATLNRLHDLGLRLAIDDFGTGYSSLAHLNRLPVDELKIDKSFVMAMERDLDDARIVRSTIELAHNLGLSVVAEGLETVKAWAMLASLGCDEGQGYFICKPMPQDQFIAWAYSWQPPDIAGVTAESLMAKLG